MKKLFTLSIVIAIFCLSVIMAHAPAFGAFTNHIILIVAPEVEKWQDDSFEGMSYKSLMTAWDTEVYKYWSGKTFDPKRFFPSIGYHTGMDFYAKTPDPAAAMAALLTGMKWSPGQSVTDKTIMQQLAQERQWQTSTVEDCVQALDVITKFIEDKNAGLSAPGLFLLVFYQGDDDREFAQGIAAILAHIDEQDLTVQLEKLDRKDPKAIKKFMAKIARPSIDWQNTFMVVTQGWGKSNEPVPIFGEGRSSYRLSGGWYDDPEVLDNTQVYQAMAAAALLITRPKMWPVLPNKNFSGNNILIDLVSWMWGY